VDEWREHIHGFEVKGCKGRKGEVLERVMLFEGIVGQLRRVTFKCTKRGRFKNFRRAGPTFGMGLFWSNVNCG